jgi:hypothetical protein
MEQQQAFIQGKPSTDVRLISELFDLGLPVALAVQGLPPVTVFSDGFVLVSGGFSTF